MECLSGLLRLSPVSFALLKKMVQPLERQRENVPCRPRLCLYRHSPLQILVTPEIEFHVPDVDFLLLRIYHNAPSLNHVLPLVIFNMVTSAKSQYK